MPFTDLPFVKGPAAAFKAGFDAVEYGWPFDEPVPKKADVDSFVKGDR